MIRKTNIFNLNIENNDTTFLTFSNYAEYLTGNFLSTDTKLFPSLFLCFNLPYDENHTTEEFKYFLLKYYENKLAAIRDSFNETSNGSAETEMKPLLYLIEGIHKFFEKDIKTDPIKIVYKSDVVEQDFKGTYTDTLCVVNLNEVFCSDDENPYIFLETSTNSEETDHTKYNPYYKVYVDEYREILYGWTDTDITTIYGENIVPEFDGADSEQSDIETPFYIVDSEIGVINLVKKESTIHDEITFNCIIPVFDVMNMKTDGVQAVVDNEDISNFVRRNIPLGIWLPDNSITISKYNGFAQNWSLVIGSKFSPLPYGTVEEAKNSDTTDSDLSYLTYAQIIYQQNELYKKFNEYLENQRKLETMLSNIQSQINILFTTDDVKEVKDMIENKYNVLDANFTEFKNETNKEINNMKEIIAGLRWKVSETQINN